nr:hypothetical protein [Coleofasciculus sp. FACHB-1120]
MRIFKNDAIANSSLTKLRSKQRMPQKVTMLDYNPLDKLPSSAELPDSDDTPVDNEIQTIILN